MKGFKGESGAWRSGTFLKRESSYKIIFYEGPEINGVGCGMMPPWGPWIWSSREGI